MSLLYLAGVAGGCSFPEVFLSLHLKKIGVSQVILCLLGITSIIEGVVLDPALYLAPSPPLKPSKDIDDKKIWSVPTHSLITSTENLAEFYEKSSTTIKPESLEVAETFWPSYRSSSLKGIYFPLSIHLSGTYGGGSSGSGVYSSAYIDMASAYDSLAKAVRPGINYSRLGDHTSLRIFGSNNRPSWSGWGNGKWGHYGKG